MARSARSRRFTVYDAMEARGAFDSNPANVDSRDDSGASLYKGPVEYPKMFYHPKGEVEVIKPGYQEKTALGIVEVAAQYGIKYLLANNEKDEEKLRRAGWHDHPAKAMEAAGLKAPAISAGDTINSLKLQIEKLNKQLEEERKLKARETDIDRALKEAEEKKEEPDESEYIRRPLAHEAETPADNSLAARLAE